LTSELKDLILSVFTYFIEKEYDIDKANRYLLAKIESLVHEYEAGVIEEEYLKELASKLREEIIQGPNNLNPFIWEILGIIEEGLNSENLKEVLEKIKDLWKEDRLDKLEV